MLMKILIKLLKIKHYINTVDIINGYLKILLLMMGKWRLDINIRNQQTMGESMVKGFSLYHHR